MKRITSVLVALLLVPTLLAACGDDDDGEEAGGALTKAEYTSQANAACKTVTDGLAEQFEGDAGFPVVKSQIVPFVARIAPIISEGMRDVSALEAPEGEDAKVKGIADEADALADRFEKAADDEAEAQKLFEEEGGFDAFEKKAETYGLEACANLDPEEDEGEEPTKLDPATFSPEKRAFVEKSDAICMKYAEEGDKVEQEVFAEGFPPELEKWAEAIPKFVDITRREIAEQRQLTPPAADKATIDGLLQRGETLLTDFEAAGKLAAEGKEDEFGTKMQELFPRFDEFDADLRAYGFQVCGSEDEGEEGEGDEEEE
jgi:hypothetical protein